MMPVTKRIVNNLQIIVALMNNYAIMSSDEWLIEAMMKN
jgi:two-component sensor histidine kinase